MPIPLRASSPGRPAHSEEVAEASLLLSRMTVLGLDVERFARSQPGMMQELRTACAACRNVRRCAFDLATSALSLASFGQKSHHSGQMTPLALVARSKAHRLTFRQAAHAVLSSCIMPG